MMRYQYHMRSKFGWGRHRGMADQPNHITSGDEHSRHLKSVSNNRWRLSHFGGPVETSADDRIASGRECGESVGRLRHQRLNQEVHQAPEIGAQCVVSAAIADNKSGSS